MRAIDPPLTRLRAALADKFRGKDSTIVSREDLRALLEYVERLEREAPPPSSLFALVKQYQD